MAGRPRRYDIKKEYEIYENKYDKLANQQRKLGQSPRYSKMSFSDFSSDWEENRLSYGPKYSGKQVAEALAKRNVYQHSFKQGKAIYKVLQSDVDFKELNVSEKSFALQYQKGLVDKSLTGFWETVKAHRKELEREGLNNDAIRVEIGQLFFGS